MLLVSRDLVNDVLIFVIIQIIISSKSKNQEKNEYKMNKLLIFKINVRKPKVFRS